MGIFRSSVVTLLKNLRRWVIRLNLGPVADLLVLRDKTGEREVGKFLKSQTFDIKSSILIGTLGNPQPTREPSTVSLTRRTEDVKLAAPPAQKSLSFKSYTTTLHVSDPNNLPVANSQLEISTDSRTPGYINGVYYVLGVEPVKISTDATGVATVIQETENINCAVLKVEAGAGTTQAVINPRMKSFEKLGQLDSASSLRHASFPTNTVAGGMRGSPQFSPLVESSVMEADVNAVAQGMKSLKTAYSHIQTPDLRSRKLFNLNCDVIPADLGHGLEITGSMIALGDLFLLLKSATDATSNVVWNAANDAWHFIVQIAEQVYHTVLDTVDAIVGTIEWIFNSVKTAITKIIRYVEFLFEWDDIRRTKDVMYNITKLFFQHQIDGISEEKKDFETMITSAEQSLGEFAGFSDWSNLGDAAKQPASANVKNPATGQTPGSQMLGNHYRTHAGDLRIVQYPVPSSKIEKDSVQRSLDGVIEALAQKQGDNSTFAKQLGDVAKEFGLMEIKAALEKLAVIIVDGILSSTWVVVDTLLDLQKELATAGFDALAAKLHIPIISDILNEIGIEDVSLLDFFTWISVTSFNVVYKIVTNTAPFLDNEDVQALITAKSWDELTPLFHTPSSMTTDLIVLVCGNLEPTLPRLDTA
ncbi:hypothetical protein AFCA_002810 [Aspergillus flavus]|nr:hypothetical protein AFCA_002810 [Aspergillus flavus]